MTPPLAELLRLPGVWRGRGPGAETRTVPSGFQRLDARLPGGGWPLATLVELLVPVPGIGELELLLPALRSLCAAPAGRRRWVAWLGPPHLPYAPGLAGAGLDPARMLVVRPRPGPGVLWAMEQALRSGACAAVLGWARQADDRALRRLKLAAAEGDSLGLLFRPPAARRVTSPAALRLLLEPRPAGLDIEILKSSGGSPARIDGLLIH